MQFQPERKRVLSCGSHSRAQCETTNCLRHRRHSIAQPAVWLRNVSKCGQLDHPFGRDCGIGDTSRARREPFGRTQTCRICAPDENRGRGFESREKKTSDARRPEDSSSRRSGRPSCSTSTLAASPHDRLIEVKQERTIRRNEPVLAYAAGYLWQYLLPVRPSALLPLNDLFEHLSTAFNGSSAPPQTDKKPADSRRRV